MSTAQDELTGNIRFRKNHRGQLIAQVEYIYTGFRWLVIQYQENRWRDATEEDFEHLPQARLIAEVVE